MLLKLHCTPLASLINSFFSSTFQGKNNNKSYHYDGNERRNRVSSLDELAVLVKGVDLKDRQLVNNSLLLSSPSSSYKACYIFYLLQVHKTIFIYYAYTFNVCC